MPTENPGAFDLLGDPIPEGFGARGRPPHIPTTRNRNRVRLLLALGWTKARIAQGLRTDQGLEEKMMSGDIIFLR